MATPSGSGTVERSSAVGGESDEAVNAMVAPSVDPVVHPAPASSLSKSSQKSCLFPGWSHHSSDASGRRRRASASAGRRERAIGNRQDRRAADRQGGRRQPRDHHHSRRQQQTRAHHHPPCSATPPVPAPTIGDRPRRSHRARRGRRGRQVEDQTRSRQGAARHEGDRRRGRGVLGRRGRRHTR